ncbi:thioesterase family protein [Pseudooceanicola onchidii]|uniref:thioesterase family protein n=1 Tax=Pseudooceanicola onchidii TaxID=2562279 RepID=UPI0010A9A66F|nr:thioesterase family protein [Pseudooceanicola onchidii]
MTSDTPTLAQLIDGMTGTAPRLTAHLTPSWMQGRTAFGGITAALALAAARKSLPDLPDLRSMQVAFLRPILQEVSFEVTLIRAGRTASFVQVDCISDDALGARITFVFGAARPSQVVHDYAPVPATPDPVSCVPLVRRSNAPSFFGNFDATIIEGDQLISGSDRPELIVWSRLTETEGVSTEVALICNADSMPPAAMTTFTERAPISTITWSLDVARMPARTDWLWTRTTSKQAAEGYSVQDMELRDTDGSLVASAQQMVALFL